MIGILKRVHQRKKKKVGITNRLISNLSQKVYNDGIG
jgi:hypothetical protein